MLNIIEEMEEEQIECKVCNQNASFRVFILKDSKPYKIISVKDCQSCGTTETSQDDFESLDYAIRITCDFSNPESKEDAMINLRRMAFINNNAKVSIFYNSSLLFDFVCDTCHIDCIQGLLMRGEDIFSLARSAEGNEDLIKSIGSRLTNIINGEGFKLIIEDESGFSRVCPFGKEYIEVQDDPVESFEENNIKYEKISRENLLEIEN